MAITGQLRADFTHFEAAVKKAEVSLKRMEDGAAKVETALDDMTKGAAPSVDKLSTSFGQLGKMIAGVVTVQAAIGFAKEITADVDRIDNAAKRLGTSTTLFQQFSYAIEQSGGDAEQASAGIVSLTERLANNDKGLLGVLRKLNIDLGTFSRSDAVSRFTQLGSAIAAVEDPAKRLEMRLESMGQKGEKALAAIDESFAKLAENAPVYSAESIAALKTMEDGWNHFWMSVKVGAAESTLAIRDFLDWRKTMVIGEDGVPKFFGGTGDVGDNPIPKSPLTAPASLGPAMDPNDVNALSLAYADLDLKLTQVQASAREAKEEFDSTNWVLKTLKMEVGNLAGSMAPLMEAFGVSTKVDQFAQRIINLANRSAELRREQERLLELINPGSSKVAGDDTDAQIFELRSDPRNFQNGNLTPQALDIEARLLDIANLRNIAANMAPVPVQPAAGGFGGNPGRIASVINAPPSIVINAQGALLNNPGTLNELARLVEDAITQRSGLTNTYSRR